MNATDKNDGTPASREADESRELQITHARRNELIWLGLVTAFFVFWATSLCPGLFLSDSFAVLGKVDKHGFDGTFSYLYQLPLRSLHYVGFSMRAVALTAFIIQLLMFYGLLFWVGRYLLRSSIHPLVSVPVGLTLVNPVFPVMYSLHSVNTGANLLFALFVFLNYRRLRGGNRSRADA